jgi:hypothetical protein
MSEPGAGGLWVPPRVTLARHRPTRRTVTLPSGERALVTVDDSGTVTHVEHGEVLDAIVRPDVIRIKVRRYWGAHGHPNPEGPLAGREGRYEPGR